jgi:N-acetylneuraminic acid mutarotase
MGHCAVVVGDEIFVLCGSQNLEDFVPSEFVYRFKPSSNEWNCDTTTGDVPPNLRQSCAVSIGSVIYVFGGRDSASQNRRELRSYDTTTKVWKILRSKGKSYPARWGSCGWTEGVFLFFFGGWQRYEGSWEIEGVYTNQVEQFNTRTETWSSIETSGARPKPRDQASLTKLRGKVYLVGGHDAKENELNDVRILDLKTFAWAELRPQGPSPGIQWNHSFTAVSSNLILLVRGDGASSILRDVWTLNIKSQTWKQEEELPEGVARHQALLVKKKAYILGGWKERKGDQYSWVTLKVLIYLIYKNLKCTTGHMKSLKRTLP